MKNIFFLLALGLMITSCEDEFPIYSGDANSGLLQFERSSYDLGVEIDNSGTTPIAVQISTVSDAERTFNITVVDESTTVDLRNLTVPSTVTIPAGSYEGVIQVSGFDPGAPMMPGDFDDITTSAEVLTLQLSGQTDTTSLGNDGITSIRVFQICPIPEDYLVGSYEISDNQIVFGGANFDTTIVDVTAAGPTSRTFATSYFGNRTIQVVLDLVCGELIFTNTYDTRYTSAGAAIILRPAADNGSTYDVSSDAFFVVEYDNEAGSKMELLKVLSL